MKCKRRYAEEEFSKHRVYSQFQYRNKNLEVKPRCGYIAWQCGVSCSCCNWRVVQEGGGERGWEVQFLMLPRSPHSYFLMPLLFTLPVAAGQFKWKKFEFATLCKARAFRNSGWQIMIQ
jgi:hypothetical protein